MPLEWFGSANGPSVGQLIARKKFARAIEVLREQLHGEASNPRVRMQLADVLVMAGRPQEAAPVLLALADDHAAQGSGAKAIAVLKKLQKIEPGRNIDRKLAALIRDTRGAPRLTPSRVKRLQVPGPVYGATINDGPVTSDEDRIAAARQASWVSTTPGEVAEEDENLGVAAPLAKPAAPAPTSQPIAVRRSPATPEAPEPESHVEILPDEEAALAVSEAEFGGQVIEIIQEALHQPAEAVEPADGETAESPLFSSFSEDELTAVIGGLTLLSFEPGDIIITEGDTGDSLFTITTGVTKTFLRQPEGGQKLVRILKEGDFFGEISILSGKPRTATVTAATACELLELDRATLDESCEKNPHVQQVLEDFYIARASS